MPTGREGEHDGDDHRDASSARRRPQARSAATRDAILEAALHEFSAHGFDAASTRAIATRVGVHQPQINYHFSSKLELWQAAVDHLFERLDAVADVEPVMAYHTLIGAISLLYSNAPEARRLIGRDPLDDDLVERHIALVAELFLRSTTTTTSSSTSPTNSRETDR